MLRSDCGLWHDLLNRITRFAQMRLSRPILFAVVRKLMALADAKRVVDPDDHSVVSCGALLEAPHERRTISSASSTTCWIGRPGSRMRASSRSAAALP